MRFSRISATYWNVAAVFLAIMVQIITAQVPVNSTALSSPRTAVSSVSIGDRVFFVGGFDFHQKVSSDKIDIFDAINQTWATPLSLPSARGFVTPVVVDPNIYFLAGISHDNPPFLYQPSNRSFVQMQSAGPTVREPKQLSLFNSVLTVVGTFTVDFYDMTSGNWSSNSNLTEVMMSLTNARIFAYQQYVFVIGGQEFKTDEISSHAWIFNYNTNELIKYDNVTTANVTFESSTYDVSNNVLVVRLSDRCLLYHFLRNEWHEELDAFNIVSSVTQNDLTHLFGDNYVIYDWINRATITKGATFIKIGFLLNDTIVYIMDEAMVVGTQKTSLPNVKVTGSVRFAQPWSSTLYTFTDDQSIYWFNSQDSSLTIIPNMTDIRSVIADGDTLHVFDYSSNEGVMNWRLFDPSPMSVIVPRKLKYPVAPQALINGVFVDPYLGTMSITDSNDIQLFSSQGYIDIFTSVIFTAHDSNTFVVMQDAPPQNGLQQYKKMDVYNYVNNTWTTKDMPDELFLPANSKRYRETFMNAAGFNDSIMVWIPGVYGIYDIKADNWTTYTNVTLGTEETPIMRTRYLDALHFQTPVIDGIAYLNHEEFNYFYKFAPDLLSWDKTAPTYSAEEDPLLIQQPVAFNHTLYVSMRQSTNITYLYYYDTALNSWQATLLPSPSTFVAITAAGDYLIAVCSDIKLHIFSVRLGQWNTQELDYEVIPSTIIHVGNVTLIAGGSTVSSGLYSDSVLVVSDDVVFIEKAPATPTSTTNQPSDQPQSTTGLTVGELVAAIVVPVVVVLAAGLALLLILLRRRKRRQTTTTVGLEQQFSEWFTPFSEIEFREQLGQGANGQVFKGKWKNTDVALKVSMTQANQSVISELSLMINMRPHPNVVQLLGFSVHPETNSVILILEYCNGGSLDKQIMEKNAPEMPINQKLQLLQGIARGVIHLHSNNIVHRDLAARNVLLHQGEPKLTDFGMSRIVDDQQQRGTTKSELGPIRWMSPESLGSKQYSTKSDVWSFGILMFEVLAQQEPHLDEDPIEVGRKIRDEGLTPQLPSSLECLSDFTSIMNQCCAFDPNYRPSIEQVLQKLEQIPL